MSDFTLMEKAYRSQHPLKTRAGRLQLAPAIGRRRRCNVHVTKAYIKP